MKAFFTGFQCCECLYVLECNASTFTMRCPNSKCKESGRIFYIPKLELKPVELEEHLVEISQNER